MTSLNINPKRGQSLNTKTFKHLTITEVQFLPIIKEYAKRVRLVEMVNRMVAKLSSFHRQ